ncbi:hypothetical protein GBAR_LOCUS16361, partial [Geodia barretti]
DYRCWQNNSPLFPLCLSSLEFQRSGVDLTRPVVATCGSGERRNAGIIIPSPKRALLLLL